MYVIVTTNRPKEPNWSGKEWSDDPAKIYSSFEDAVDAIKAYWYSSWFPDHTFDHRPVRFTPLTEKKMQKLIIDKKARL